MVNAALRRDAVLLGALALGCTLAAAGVHVYLEGAADAEYLFWFVGGSALLVACLVEGGRGAIPLLGGERTPAATDSLFLLIWICGPLLFSVLLVPFQAVRHVIVALPPLVLLGLRSLERGGDVRGRVGAAALAAVVALQVLVGLAVAVADYDLARAYRDFAPRAAALRGQTERAPWYTGSWGWYRYAEAAGLRRLGSRPPFPGEGDLVVQPKHVSRPRDADSHPALAGRLRKIDEVVYPGRVPFRTIHPDAANFYAVLSRRGPGRLPYLPYRWLPAEPVERFEIFEVGPPEARR